MADPQHVPTLDRFDELTVRIYRAGIILSSLGLLLASGLAFARPEQLQVAWVTVLIGAAMSISCMHLYDKRVRWVIGASGWLGAALMVGGLTADGTAGHWLGYAGLGFVFVSLSGFALKEQFCFRIPGLRLVPLFLASSLIPLVIQQPQLAGVLLLYH